MEFEVVEVAMIAAVTEVAVSVVYVCAMEAPEV